MAAVAVGRNPTRAVAAGANISTAPAADAFQPARAVDAGPCTAMMAAAVGCQAARVVDTGAWTSAEGVNSPGANGGRRLRGGRFR